ncbi:MAG: CPBP family intramembrane metalloprotease [Lachnospiraceae bacterium]|nr:CPBP family intramembrane metalloprotease [Lachnospiraceae bacterium]MDE6185941.1 CPBP family intramembrane metalloprotease [Lachnospiraceae bacterium]
MNSKKANWAFLITIIGYFVMVIVIGMFFPFVIDDLVLGNLACEAVVVLPVLIFALASKEKLISFLGFRRIKFRSVLMIGLFTFLSMPVLSLLNLFTQFWVKNEIADTLGSQQGKIPFTLMYLSVGIIAPVFEEIACRGAYYRSYCKSGSAFKAMMLSAVIFALVHMNFNQAAYAFIMGIFAVLLVEATGSLWASVLYHGFINGSQVILLYTVLEEGVDAYSENMALTPELLMCAIGVYVIFTAVTLPLAWAVLVWIGRTEGRSQILSDLWTKRKQRMPHAAGHSDVKEKKDKMVTLPFLLAVAICLVVMTGFIGIILEQIVQLIFMRLAS